MELRYMLESSEREKRFRVSNRSHLDMIATVYEELDVCNRKLLKDSCFKNLLPMPKLQVSGTIIHHLIQCLSKTMSDDEFWFIITGQSIRFSLIDFAVLTGLKIVGDTFVDESLGQNSPLSRKYFEGLNPLYRVDLKQKFLECQNRKDKYKLGLLMILSYVIIGLEDTKGISWWWFDLVEDLKSFNNYPWGKLSYKMTTEVLKRDLSLPLKGPNVASYSVHGFPLSIMVLVFESIPSIANYATRVEGQNFPRFMKWQMTRRLQSKDILAALEMYEMDVITELTLSDAERAHVFGDCVRFVADEDSVFIMSNDKKGLQKLYAILERMEGKIDVLMSDKNDIGNGQSNDFDKEVEHEEEEHVAVESEEAEDVAVETEEAEDVTVETEEAKDVAVETEEAKDVAVESDEVEDVTVESEEAEDVAVEHEVMVGAIVVREEGEDVIVETIKEGEDVAVETVEVKMDASGRYSLKERVEVDENETNEVRGKRKKQKERTKRGKTKRKLESHKESEIAVKINYLNNWLATKARERHEVIVFDEVVIHSSALKEVVATGWVTSEIMEAALFLLRHHIEEQPIRFQKQAYIFDPWFQQYVTRAYNNGAKLCSILQNWANGLSGVKPRSKIIYIYFPVNYCSHWFACKLDVTEECLYVYDSLPRHIRKRDFDECMKPLTVMIPLLYSEVVKGGKHLCLKVVKVKGLLKSNGNDCGIYAIKFIEFLVEKQDLEKLKSIDIQQCRRNIVAEILSHAVERSDNATEAISDSL